MLTRQGGNKTPRLITSKIPNTRCASETNHDHGLASSYATIIIPASRPRWVPSSAIGCVGYQLGYRYCMLRVRCAGRCAGRWTMDEWSRSGPVMFGGRAPFAFRLSRHATSDHGRENAENGPFRFAVSALPPFQKDCKTARPSSPHPLTTVRSARSTGSLCC